jgi:hypothetical protein
MYMAAPHLQTSAFELPNRSVTIGTSRPSEVTTHVFNFDIVSSSTLGSIEFLYCVNSPLQTAPCVSPSGFSAVSTSLIAQSGETGFSIHPASGGNRIVISRAPSNAFPQPSSYTFDNIVNPSDQQMTYFVRISTYASVDATGPLVDEGPVAFATTRSLVTTGFVPPYLTFCVGVTVALDCSTTTGDFINFGELLRTVPSAATSEFSTATNDPAGYNVGIYGNTMTSGSNIIPELAVNSPSIVGTSQYGLNIAQNFSPVIGQPPQGVGTGVGNPVYSIPNSFRFVSSDTLASSPLPTQFNKFTVSYLVNVNAGQPAGVYVTTMTYIATALF